MRGQVSRSNLPTLNERSRGDGGDMSESTGDTGEQRVQQTDPAKPSSPTMSDEGVVWVRSAPSPAQVVRTVAVALLTAVVVLGGLYLLWQVRSFIGWFVIALFLAATLNPAVNWLQRRHRMIKRSLAIVITYLGVLVALVLMVRVFVPVLIDELQRLIDFIVAVAQAPEGPTEYLRSIADQYGFGWLFDSLSEQLSDLPSRLGELAKSFLLSAGGIAIGAAGFVASLVTILTLTFFMLLGVPYPAALALLVAVLDLIPLVGATLGAVIVIVVAFFVAWRKALILLIFFLVYQQFEGSVLQPMVYSRAVHLNGLTIFCAVLVGGLLLGIPGALLAIPVAEIVRIVVTELLAYRRAARVEVQEEEPAVSSPSLQPPT